MTAIDSWSSASSGPVLMTKNLPIIHKILLNSSCSIYSGVHCSELENLLLSHGIPVCENNFHASLMALLHHLVSGLCVYNSNVGCQSIVKSNDVSNLTLAISDQVLKAPLDIL